MPERAVHLLVVDGFAGWEPAHAVAELRRNGQYRVESVGPSMAPVESTGGIRMLPSTTVADPTLERLLTTLDAQAVPLAAICAATTAAAR